MESVELNEDQLDAVSGGLVAQDRSEKWRVVKDDGTVYYQTFDTKSGAQFAAVMAFRSPEEISWDDVERRQRENS